MKKPSTAVRDSFPLYPLLGISYFFLHVWAQNFERGLRFSLLFRPYFLSIAFALLLWLLLAWVFRSISKAAFFVFFLSFCFFSYGHFRNLLLTYVIRIRVPQMVFISLFIVLAVVIPGTFLSLSRFQFKKINRYLNIVTGILLFFPLGYIASHTFYAVPHYEEYYEPLPKFTKKPELMPDIYYIVLDEYAREDALKTEYGFDNKPFLDQLRKRGFEIAEQSRSNYLQTDYSLSSALNMRYLRSVDEDFPDLVRNNLVSRALKERLGYRYVFVNSGCTLSESSPTADDLISYFGTNDVELLMANTTMVNAFTAFFFAQSWRYRHLYNFEQLAKVPKKPGRKFIFAHMLLPHPPFVFNADGSPFNKTSTIRLTPVPFGAAKYDEAYPGQVTYANMQVIQLVDKLIASSAVPPVIILQSDHGLDPVSWDSLSTEDYVRKRSANFTAVRLPGGEKGVFPATVTPVNTFRILFSHYFGADLPPMEDKFFTLEDTEERPIFKEIRLNRAAIPAAS